MALRGETLTDPDLDPPHRPYVETTPQTPDGRLTLGPLTYEPGAETAEGEPRVSINATDAADRQIAGGDSVEVHNDRGSLTLTATVSSDVPPGVVAIPFGWWHSHSPDHRGVNALTNPQPAADGRGSAAFHDTLVDVRLYQPDA